MKKVTRIEEGTARCLVMYSGTFPCVSAHPETKKIFTRKNNGRNPSESHEFPFDLEGCRAAARFVGMAILAKDVWWMIKGE